MSNHFVKLHGTILDSSVWGLPDATRIVWITMLAMADADGVVSASVDGLARRAVVPVESCQKALKTFLGPDPYSRDGTDGQRIESIPGGWLILNHGEYRERRTDAQIQTAARVARHRAKSRGVTLGNDVTLGNARLRTEAEADAEADSDAEKEEEEEEVVPVSSQTGSTETPVPSARVQAEVERVAGQLRRVL